MPEEQKKRTSKASRKRAARAGAGANPSTRSVIVEDDLHGHLADPGAAKEGAPPEGADAKDPYAHLGSNAPAGDDE